VVVGAEVEVTEGWVAEPSGPVETLTAGGPTRELVAASAAMYVALVDIDDGVPRFYSKKRHEAWRGEVGEGQACQKSGPEEGTTHTWRGESEKRPGGSDAALGS